MPGPSATSGVTKPWLIATGLWFAGIVAFNWLNIHTGSHHTICLFKNLTDIPCPGCGGTRAALALAKGHPGEAFSFNPLASSLILLSPLILFGWTRNLQRKPAQRWHPGRVFWAISIVLVITNWIYVMRNLP